MIGIVTSMKIHAEIWSVKIVVTVAYFNLQDGPIFVLFLIIQIIYLINSYSRSTNLKEVVTDIKKRQDMLDQLVNILQERERKRALEQGESVITQITYEPVIEEDNTKLEEELGLGALEKGLKGLVSMEVQVDLGLENMAELG